MVKMEFDKEVRSFVSFALAMSPELIVTGDRKPSDEDSRAVRLRFNDKRKMSDHEYASLESLLSKLKRIEDFMPPSKSLDDLAVMDSFPTVSFQPNTQYQIISISAEQLDIAKDVARRARRIRDQDASGDRAVAKREFDDLQDVLGQKRKQFIGSFESVRDIDDAVGMHAVGSTGQPQSLACGPCIFVLIEIWVS